MTNIVRGCCRDGRSKKHGKCSPFLGIQGQKIPEFFHHVRILSRHACACRLNVITYTGLGMWEYGQVCVNVCACISWVSAWVCVCYGVYVSVRAYSCAFECYVAHMHVCLHLYVIFMYECVCLCTHHGPSLWLGYGEYLIMYLCVVKTKGIN